MQLKILKILTTAAFMAASIIVGGLYLLYYYGRGLPDYQYLKTYDPPVLTRLYTSDGQPLSEYATEKRLFVPINLIPDQLKNAFLAAEDKNFYYHFGVDILSTCRAIIINTLSNGWQRHPGGASTITQQVSKNFLVGNERSLSRKIKEAIMSFRLEEALPKDRIFELYLNEIYLGSGAYGVAAAALIYFDKELDELSLDESAFIASLPKAPTALTNKQALGRAMQRRNWVIDRMLQNGAITPTQAHTAKSKELVFKKHREHTIQANYFSSEIHRELVQKFQAKKVVEGGLTVKSTLDPVLQKLADKALQKGLLEYDKRYGWRGPICHIKDIENWQESLKNITKPLGGKSFKLGVVLSVTNQEAIVGLEDKQKVSLTFESVKWACREKPPLKFIPQSVDNVLEKGDVILVGEGEAGTNTLEQVPEISGAIVVMDPHTGRVLAMSGGSNFEINQFNCATQAKRQPGSAFKPFVYLAALEKGFSPESKILDAPINISLGKNRGYYTPKNYSRRYYGPSSLRTGLEQSRNVMTIRLAQQVGMQRIINIARDFGVQEKMPRQLAMVLGAGETTLIQLTAAYGMLANGGKKIYPHIIDSVQDRYGNVLLDYTKPTEPEYVATKASIYQLTSMLIGVTQRGTAKRLQSLGFPVAGKTGTTNDYKDAWFLGYTEDLVVGVFVGFLVPKSLGKHETGGRVAVPIFESFIRDAYKDLPKPRFANILDQEEDEKLIVVPTESEDRMHDFVESEMHFVANHVEESN